MGKYNWRDFINWGSYNFEVKNDEEVPIKDSGPIGANLKYQYKQTQTKAKIRLFLFQPVFWVPFICSWNKYALCLRTFPRHYVNNDEWNRKSLSSWNVLSMRVMTRMWWETRMQGVGLTWTGDQGRAFKEVTFQLIQKTQPSEGLVQWVVHHKKGKRSANTPRWETAWGSKELKYWAKAMGREGSPRCNWKGR